MLLTINPMKAKIYMLNSFMLQKSIRTKFNPLEANNTDFLKISRFCKKFTILFYRREFFIGEDRFAGEYVMI
jgi:hypothetical protein